MPQTTERQLGHRIRELLNELNKKPPEKHEVVRIPWSGTEYKNCTVVNIEADEVLLNPDSHRLRSQLQDDPRWAELSKVPFSDDAQIVLAEHIKKARDEESFEALKESLRKEGQTHPGVMTHEGVLVNANTRAVALRELEDPGKRYVRVAVLPGTATQPELALLELRLQMQKELKEDYSLTNELLFVEEMFERHKTPAAQIAHDLRYFPGKPKKGAEEVELRLEMLDLIRQMQTIPAGGLKLTFFDQVGLEQLRGLLTRYRPIGDSDPARARKLLETWLLSVAVGVSNVHALRRVDEDFVDSFVVPNLEEDEEIGTFAPALVAEGAETATDTSSGNILLNEEEENGAYGASIARMLDIATQEDKRVEVPGTKVVLDRDEVKESFRAAVVTGIKDKRREKADEDKIEAPTAGIKSATRQVEKSLEALKAVHADEEFDTRRRKSLGVAFGKLRKRVHELETAFEKYSIPTK